MKNTFRLLFVVFCLFTSTNPLRAQWIQTMMCSALLRHGPRKIREVLTEVQQWMVEHEYTSLNDMRGRMSHQSVADPSSFERANYMKALQTYM